MAKSMEIRFSLAVVITGLLAGCAGSGVDNQPTVLPARITGFSANRLAVGDQLTLSGSGFLTPDQGWVDVRFAGTFSASDGSGSQPVDLTIPLQANDAGQLVWERFGAYRVPFGPGDKIGTFDGKVYAINRYYSGEEVPSTDLFATPATLEVAPSVVLVDMRAVGHGWIADCKFAATTAINEVPYLMHFKAVGFEASQFLYTFGEGFLVDGQATTSVTRYNHPMLSNDHTMLVAFAEVPDNTQGFQTSVIVQGTATDGSQYMLDVPILVRRPLQVYFPDPMAIAQIYQPQPVSGCIPGGQVGITTAYSESTSETRTRQLTNTQSVGWDKTYGQQFTDTYGKSNTQGTDSSTNTTNTVTDGRTTTHDENTTYTNSMTQGFARTNHIDYTQMSTNSYDWTVNNESHHDFNKEVGGMAGGSLFGIVDIGAQGKVGWVDGTSMGTSQHTGTMNTTGTTSGTSSTTSQDVTEGVARSQGTSWGISQTYAEANSFTQGQHYDSTDSYSDAATKSTSLGMQLQTSQSVSESVSTTNYQGLVTSGNVPALENAVWYRQTTRLVRVGVIVAYDLCGNGSPVGNTSIDDWTWAPDLAIGNSCPPPPDLPPAQCLLEPCDGQ
jgi:hypothetical protein